MQVHPDFESTGKLPGLIILDGNKGEKPRPGAFYSAHYDETISGVAKKAYGDAAFWRTHINANPYNRDTLVYHAEYSGKLCKSKKVDPSKGYVGVCPNDRAPWMKEAGFKTPVMWLPSLDNPMELPRGGLVPEEPKGFDFNLKPIKKVIIKTNEPKQDPGKPKVVIFDKKKPAVGPSDNRPDSPAPGPAPKRPAPIVVPSKLGLWIAGIGFMGLVIAAVVLPMMKKDGKGKKKASKKGKGR